MINVLYLAEIGTTSTVVSTLYKNEFNVIILDFSDFSLHEVFNINPDCILLSFNLKDQMPWDNSITLLRTEYSGTLPIICLDVPKSKEEINSLIFKYNFTDYLCTQDTSDLPFKIKIHVKHTNQFLVELAQKESSITELLNRRNFAHNSYTVNELVNVEQMLQGITLTYPTSVLSGVQSRVSGLVDFLKETLKTPVGATNGNSKE